MNPTTDFERRISGSLLRLRSRAPFFAALALFARVLLRDDLPTAATDGRDIFWNPEFLDSLSRDELDAVMLHEVLHAALLHVPRRGARNPRLWNVAADIVVNGIVAAQKGMALPAGALRDKKLEGFSVEEVYELLQKDGWSDEDCLLTIFDLLEMPTDGADTAGVRAALEAHWRNARAQAGTLVRTLGRGTLPAGMERELGALEPAKLDWRAHLWRYLARTPVDFEGFDRRFIGRGLYLEALEGESLRVFVGIDTSGSIGDREMKGFLSEVQGILRAYPHLVCDLFYVDAEAHGPYRLHPSGETPRPVGGGGTDFRPFFDAVAPALEEHGESVCIYLTDGYGAFPERAPAAPVLWVVTAGGLGLDEFPFGETVRLIDAPQ